MSLLKKSLDMLKKPKLPEFRDNFLKSFCQDTPIFPQIVIGLGAVFVRPLIILSNKAEDKAKRVYTATRTFVQESIALPIALTAGIGAGWVGKKLARGSHLAGTIVGLATTLGMLQANIVIPGLTTMSLKKLPIKEKVEKLVAKNETDKSVKTPNKLDVTSKTVEIQTTAVQLTKPRLDAETFLKNKRIQWVSAPNPVKTLEI